VNCLEKCPALLEKRKQPGETEEHDPVSSACLLAFGHASENLLNFQYWGAIARL
jgi:hypothetical protein